MTLLEDSGELVLSTDDLPDAYRGCPVHPDDLPASTIAVWHPQSCKWVFFMLQGLAFGLSSAVLSFNRLPTILTAVLRRMHVTIAAAYFDDMPVVDVACARASGTQSLRAVAAAVGAPPSPGKSFGPGQ